MQGSAASPEQCLSAAAGLESLPILQNPHRVDQAVIFFFPSCLSLCNLGMAQSKCIHH